MSKRNKYDPKKHEDYVTCPRTKCQSRNAPKGSDAFHHKCWKCSAPLPVEQEVSVGDELEIDVFDMHESGAGVGKEEDGFIILADGALPDGRFKVRVTQVFDSYAEAEVLEKVSDSLESENDSDEEEEEDERLGSRENHWGG